MLSTDSSGKSEIISSLVIPFANQFKTSATEILVPMIVGFPKRLLGLISIYLLNSIAKCRKIRQQCLRNRIDVV